MDLKDLSCQISMGLSVVSRMENQDVICRLCLKNCGGKLKAIGGSLEEMFDTLLPKLNSIVSESPFICTSCEDVLNRCFEFKSTCLFMQTNIISNIDIGDNAKANPKDVASSEDLNTCSLCISVLKNCHFISFNNVDEEMLDQVFERFIPELDLSVTTKPAICKACYEHLHIYFNLMRNCYILEETIRDNNSLMSPQDVQNHTSSKDICKETENNVGIIKIEEPIYENEFNNKDSMPKFTSKNVLSGNDGIEVDKIKTERIICETLENEYGSKQRCKNLTALQDMPQCTSGEIYEPNEIKTEEMICEEKENEFDHKNYSEMEDTKCLDVVQLTSINVTCNGVIADEELKIEDESKCEIVLVDHKFNKQQKLSSKNVLECEEEGNEQFTETDGEKLLPRSHEKIEIVLTDQRSFDSHTNSIFTMYQCESCSYQTRSKRNLKVHSIVHKSPSEVTTYQCYHCPFKTKHRSSFSKHVSGHKEKKLYQCDFCSFKSANRLGLSNHKLIHKNATEKKMFCCDSCPFQTIYKRAFIRHSSKHENPSVLGLYQCKSCTFKAETKSDLRNHNLEIHKKPPIIRIYQCPSCSYQAKNKVALQRHNSIHNDLSSNKNSSTAQIYQCKTCLYHSRSKNQLESHLLVHKKPSEVTMYQCKSCSYQTKRKASMDRHVLIHRSPSNVKIYRCDHCPYQTKYKTCLSKHFLGHNVGKSSHFPYQCDLCSFRSINKSGLSIHMMIHKKELFECDSCPFQTIYKSVFARHSLTHKTAAAILMYQCTSCPFKGTSKRAVRKHKFMHHSIKHVKMYCCASCQYQTNNKSSLRKHVVTHNIRDQFRASSAKNELVVYKYSLRDETRKLPYKDQEATRNLSTYSNSHKVKSESQAANCFLLASAQNPLMDPPISAPKVDGKQGSLERDEMQENLSS